MKNYEIVMKELRQLPNLDENLYTQKGLWREDNVRINLKGEDIALEHGTLQELVHGIRALKLTGLDGNVENIKKGLSVFSMLQSIYAYHSTMTASEMANKNIFSDKMYDLGYESVKAMAQYLIDNTAKIETCVYTDGEGCSYNSLEMVEV